MPEAAHIAHALDGDAAQVAGPALLVRRVLVAPGVRLAVVTLGVGRLSSLGSRDQLDEVLLGVLDSEEEKLREGESQDVSAARQLTAKKGQEGRGRTSRASCRRGSFLVSSESGTRPRSYSTF